jgi:hypothetical protein
MMPWPAKTSLEKVKEYFPNSIVTIEECPTCGHSVFYITSRKVEEENALVEIQDKTRVLGESDN